MSKDKAAGGSLPFLSCTGTRTERTDVLLVLQLRSRHAKRDADW